MLNLQLRINPMPAHPKHANLRTPPGVIAGIIGVSAAASALICWLVYFHAPTDVAGTHLRSLPLVNAVLNALATIALVTGFQEIRERRILQHRASMFFAFLFSSIFLVCYLVNFTLHGETPFRSPTGAALDQLRLCALLTHIPLAILALPHDSDHLLPFAHRAFSGAQAAGPLDLPIWLYVSVSGVFVYLLQAVIRVPPLAFCTLLLLVIPYGARVCVMAVSRSIPAGCPYGGERRLCLRCTLSALGPSRREPAQEKGSRGQLSR